MIRDRVQKIVIILSFLIAPIHPERSERPSFGVKVLSVDAGSEAGKAGISPGDVILTWRQGTVAGDITSPLDFKGIERERAPRGVVKLRGLRADRPVSWTLKAQSWGITSGSTVSGVQTVIDHLAEFAKAKNWDALGQYCRMACTNLEPKLGGRSYAFFETGRQLASAQKMTDAAEFFGKAITEEPKARTYFAAQVYEAWAEASYDDNDWASTYRFYRKALRASQTLAQTSLNAAFYLQRLARGKWRAGELKDARLFALQALRTVESAAPKSDLTVRILNTLATIDMTADDQSTAKIWLQKALKLGLEVSPMGDTLAMVYNSLGNVSNETGDAATAEKYYFQSLEIAKRIDPEGAITSNAWANLGHVFGNRHNYKRAEQCQLRALALEEKQGPSAELDVALTLNQLASYRCDAGDSAAAIKLLQRSLAIQRRVAPHNRDIVGTLHIYAQALQRQGDHIGAEAVLLKSLAIDQQSNPNGPSIADCHSHLGDLYLSERNYRDAEKQYQIALGIERKFERQSTYYADTLAGLAASAKGLGDDAEALKYYSDAFSMVDSEAAVLDRSDSIHLSADYAEYLAQFVELLVSHGQTHRALEVFDHARARTLVRILAEANVNIVSGIPTRMVEKDRKLEFLLAELSDQRIRILTEGHGKGLREIDGKIANAIVERDLTEDQMRAVNPHYAALTQPKPPALSQIQYLLGAETVLLEYSLGKEQSYLFAVDRNRISAFPLPGRSEIERLAKISYSAWSKPGRTRERERSDQQLSNIVLGPVATLLKGRRRLLVVADGGLQYIPFSALPIPAGSDHEGYKVAALYEVVNLPSASLLVTLRQHPTHRSNNRDSIAIIGDPVFSADDSRIESRSTANEPVYTATRGTHVSPAEAHDDEIESVLNDEASVRGLQLTRLIHSREEAEAIASVAKKDHLVMALDFDANRSAATGPQISNTRIVHFATHGVFDSKNPAMSGLVFSLVDKQGKPQPGFLGLDDVYRSHYSADLVVLSACETALGEEVNSEGLVGLTWGFIYAGAKSVVASLWQVNDASTAELMRVFYAGMLQKGLSPSAALREAQLTISKNSAWSDPYYWAGFVLEGEYAK